jgi:hypothetical protein
MLAIIAIGIAVVGGSQTVPYPWSSNLVIIGFGSLLLIIADMILSEIQHRKKDKEYAASKAQIAELRVTITSLVGLLSSKRDVSFESPVASDSLVGLSNPQLMANVHQFSNVIRYFEQSFLAKEYAVLDAKLGKRGLATTQQDCDQRNHRLIQMHLDHQNEFNKKYLGEAASYWFELQKRTLNTTPTDERQMATLTGHLAGPHPLDDLASFLEKLGNKLWR